MADKQQRRTYHCGVAQWLKEYDRDLYDTFEDLCMLYLLNSRPAGVTFFYPTDAKLRGELAAKARGSDAPQAVRLLKSLVAPVLLEKPEDIAAGAGSRLGVLFEVEKTQANGRVHLKGGAVVAPSKQYRQLPSDGAGAAVWDLLEGRLPLEGPAFEPPRARRQRGTRGGGEAAGLRRALARKVEGDYAAAMARDHCTSRNPFLSAVSTLLHTLQVSYPAVLDRILALLDRNPVTCFYLLLEPYKTTGEYLVPDEVVAFWNGLELSLDPAAEFAGFFEMRPSEGADAKCFAEPEKLMAAVNRVRGKVIVAGRPEIPMEIIRVYRVLAAENTVGGFGPVLPAATLAAARDRLLWMDWIRHASTVVCDRLEHCAKPTADDVEELFSLFRLHPGNDYDNEVQMCRTDLAVPNREDMVSCMTFLCTLNFLHFPAPLSILPAGEAPLVWNYNPFDESAGNELLNTEKTNMRAVARLAPAQGAAAALTRDYIAKGAAK